MSAPDPDQVGLIAKYGGWVVSLISAAVMLGVAVVGGLMNALRSLRHSKADIEQVDRLHAAVLDLYRKHETTRDAIESLSSETATGFAKITETLHGIHSDLLKEMRK